jgi:hypothetical protein
MRGEEEKRRGEKRREKCQALNTSLGSESEHCSM